jgi:NAD(P)-dependent dehydrogenase (short-subunit alcohol dehydrogenase family)
MTCQNSWADAAAAAPAEHVQPVGAGDLVDAAADRGGIDVLVNNAALSEELGPKKRACRLGRRRTRSTHARDS